MSSIRFRADVPSVLVEALLETILYARVSTEDFSFSPVTLSALDRDGLLLEGDIVNLVVKLKEKFPTLIEE